MIIQCDKDFDLHTSAALIQGEAIFQVPAVPAIGNTCSPHVYLQDAAVSAHQVNKHVVFITSAILAEKKTLAHCAPTSTDCHNSLMTINTNMQ